MLRLFFRVRRAHQALQLSLGRRVAGEIALGPRRVGLEALDAGARALDRRAEAAVAAAFDAVLAERPADRHEAAEHRGRADRALDPGQRLGFEAEQRGRAPR